MGSRQETIWNENCKAVKKDPCPRLDELQKSLKAKLQEISEGYEKVTLFIGSQRQSQELETSDSETYKNGKAKDGLAALVEELKSESGGTPRWVFNSRTLET